MIELFAAKPAQAICNRCGETIETGENEIAMVQVFFCLVDKEGGYLVSPSSVQPSQFIFCPDCSIQVEAEPGKVLIKSTDWYDKHYDSFEGCISSEEVFEKVKTEAGKMIMANLQRKMGGPNA